MPPSAEEFARWRDDNVTRWVMKALEATAAANEAAWHSASWVNGVANQQRLIEMRTRAQACLDLCATDYEGFCDMLNEEPLRD